MGAEAGYYGSGSAPRGWVDATIVVRGAPSIVNGWNLRSRTGFPIVLSMAPERRPTAIDYGGEIRAAARYAGRRRRMERKRRRGWA